MPRMRFFAKKTLPFQESSMGRHDCGSLEKFTTAITSFHWCFPMLRKTLVHRCLSRALALHSLRVVE